MGLGLLQELIELGAVTLIVPGDLPIGCSAAYLTYFRSSNKLDYDPAGCLKWLNKFSKYHNQMLQKEIKSLRKIHSHANIIYADYYGAAAQIYRSPIKLGTCSLSETHGIIFSSHLISIADFIFLVQEVLCTILI